MERESLSWDLVEGTVKDKLATRGRKRKQLTNNTNNSKVTKLSQEKLKTELIEKGVSVTYKKTTRRKIINYRIVGENCKFQRLKWNFRPSPV